MKSLYRKQRELDRTIEERFALTSRAQLTNILCAFYVELGEFLDSSTGEDMDIEEYADGLHFVLSIGHRLDIPDIEVSLNQLLEQIYQTDQQLNPNACLRNVLIHASRLGNAAPDFKFWKATRQDAEEPVIQDLWNNLCAEYGKLGILMGWVPSQIRQAYNGKHEVNYQRQDGGY